jgi:hypothetical protein
MPKFRVPINDNAPYMDESERSDNGVFASAEEAVAACKAIVDDEPKYDVEARHNRQRALRALHRMGTPILSSCRSIQKIRM